MAHGFREKGTVALGTGSVTGLPLQGWRFLVVLLIRFKSSGW